MSTMTDIKSHAPSSVSLSEIWKRIKGFFRFGQTSVDQASLYMLGLYRTNLEVRLRMIDESALQTESQKKIYATLVETLKASSTEGAEDLEWDGIYKAESLIALLFSGSVLRQEISARLQELSLEEPAEAEARRREYDALLKPADGANAGPDDAMLRAFLLRLMEAIHWSAKKKYLARPIRIEATNRILIGVCVAFAALVSPYVFIVWDYGRSGANGLPVGPLWTLFALWTALTAGLLGAFFSRLISIQRQWSKMTLDEVFLHREWPYTFLRAGVGVCGALIVYFFLRLEIATGPLFPDFGKVRLELVNVAGASDVVGMAFVMPSAALALLTFWCFLAGFSEALVPSILSSAERQLVDAATPAQSSRK